MKKYQAKEKKELCLLYASKDLSVLSPSKGWKKSWVLHSILYLWKKKIYFVILMKMEHDGKNKQNKEGFQRNPSSQLLIYKEGLPFFPPS